MLQADLHIHSVYSDGLHSPDEICRIAKQTGLGLISITDHDTLNGEDVKREAAKRYGLQYLSGWEVSAYQDGHKIHVLGYGCERNDAYAAFMEDRKQASFKRAQNSVEKFQALGVPLTMEKVLSMQADHTAPLHTMHIARAAALLLGMKEGDVYLAYLAKGKPANSGFGRPTPYDAIDCIHEAGGIAVIAHPGRIHLPADEKEKLLTELLDYGADGIETFYSTHTEEETEYYRAFTAEKGVFATGGSDTHYQGEKNCIGTPVFYPSEGLLSYLKERGKIK